MTRFILITPVRDTLSNPKYSPTVVKKCHEISDMLIDNDYSVIEDYQRFGLLTRIQNYKHIQYKPIVIIVNSEYVEQNVCLISTYEATFETELSSELTHEIVPVQSILEYVKNIY
jgi:hypothetical protein